MVTLNRIYTGVGDKGSTRLVDGSEVPKFHPRVTAYGNVDEANAILGLVACEELPENIAAELRCIQNDCFDLGSDFATPPGGQWEDRIPRITESQVKRVEAAIDAANEHLEPLKSFTLPGGSRASALLHQARTVVRRAERASWRADAEEREAGGEGLNRQALLYLNRLSDLCFVWSRVCNDNGAKDALWKPGDNQ